tara:strand:- start:27 stop:494 length:468 start_codon:yes stop_codon:yes gene_type:complete
MDEKVEQSVTNIITAYIAQIDSAMKISEILAEHSGDEDISPDNLIIGLIYRLMVPMTDAEMKESMDNASKVMDGDTSDEEDDSMDTETTNELHRTISGEKNKVERKIKSNNCNCDICSKARVCLLNYPQYEASDELAQKFSDSIKHACSTHKLLI